MSESIFDDKPPVVPVQPFPIRSGILVISAFLLGSYAGNFVDQPIKHLMMAGGLVGLVAYLTMYLVIKHRGQKAEQERTCRTESRLEKHVSSLSSTNLPVMDGNAIQKNSSIS